MMRILVFVFLVLPFTAVTTQGVWARLQETGNVDVVDTLIAGLLLLLSLGYIRSFWESLRDTYFEAEE